MNESVLTLFDASVKKWGHNKAIKFFDHKHNLWVTKTWQEINATINQIANALINLNLDPQSRIAILSATRPEWVLIDIAIMKASGISVPIYQSSLADQVEYILKDSTSTVIFVENESQVQKIREITTYPLKVIIILDNICGPLNANEIYFHDFIDNYKTQLISPIIDKSTIASIVYTSGTTGEPKGAMISHDNLVYEALAIDKLGILTNKDVQLIFLPLAHIFARVLVLAWVRTGHLLAFAQSIDNLIANMSDIKPTIMASVPRIFEKVRLKAIESALNQSTWKKQLVKLALDEADRLSLNPNTKTIKTWFYKMFIFNRIGKLLHKKFGGRLRFFVSGGAPLSPEVLTFFHLANITICEGYGLTETTAATCINLPWHFKVGTVGKVIPGSEIKLSEDKEILVKGRGVFLGFWRKPKESEDVLAKDGWFHTGDIGEIDNDGYVQIVDRKRDIIVTSQGKNIAPQRVENMVKTKSPLIAHVIVIGDKKPYLTALIALDPVTAKNFSQENLPELASIKVIYDEVKKAIDSANLSLASFEQIKRFHILDKELEMGKEITPTLKVKRKTCIELFAKDIKSLYS